MSLLPITPWKLSWEFNERYDLGMKGEEEKSELFAAVALREEKIWPGTGPTRHEQHKTDGLMFLEYSVKVLDWTTLLSKTKYFRC